MKTTRNSIGLSILATTLAALVGLASPAWAEEASASAEDWVPVKHLEFTDEDIQGGITAPDGTLIQSVPRARHSSLIEIRQGFEPEIVKMTEEL
jgi:hypothetical protein